jgi:hypothetical protein
MPRLIGKHYDKRHRRPVARPSKDDWPNKPCLGDHRVAMEGCKARTGAASVHLLVVERASIYSNMCIRFAFLTFDS